MLSSLPLKDPAESYLVTFDFSSLVDSIDSVSISVSLERGEDTNIPDMILDAATIAGATVLQRFKKGSDGATYIVRADITSGNDQYALAGYMSVQALK